MFKRSAQVSFDGVSVKPITDLRIAFEIDKDDGQQLNRGTIRIYNLNSDSRAQLAKPYPIGYPLIDPIIRVFLKAGYGGDNVQLLAGELLSGINTKEGPDWITTLEIWSGINATTKGISNFSFGDPTKAKVIADRLLSVLNIDVRYTDEADDLINNLKVTDYTSSGLSFREISLFLRRFGLSFTIEEDGQGLVYVDDRPRNPEAGQTSQNTFSPQNGLVGSPAITRTGIEIRALLRPQIRLLERFFVESRTISGTLVGNVVADYHAISIKHTGDTRGEDWFTEIEGAYSNLIAGDYS